MYPSIQCLVNYVAITSHAIGMPDAVTRIKPEASIHNANRVGRHASMTQEAIKITSCPHDEGPLLGEGTSDDLLLEIRTSYSLRLRLTATSVSVMTIREFPGSDEFPALLWTLLRLLKRRA
jgi:hypothetical protein